MHAAMLSKKSYNKAVQTPANNIWLHMVGTVSKGSGNHKKNANARGNTPEFRHQAQDSFSAFIVEELLPTFWQCNKLQKGKQKQVQLKAKIKKVVDAIYIEEGLVRRLTGFFNVPKGMFGIQVVHHAHECVLNSAL
eukprot:11177008-Ditylum_brightwellii.AAC.1